MVEQPPTEGLTLWVPQRASWRVAILCLELAVSELSNPRGESDPEETN